MRSDEPTTDPWEVVRVAITVRDAGGADWEFMSEEMSGVQADILLLNLPDARVVKARKVRKPEGALP